MFLHASIVHFLFFFFLHYYVVFHYVKFRYPFYSGWTFDCFQFGAIVNAAAENILVPCLWWMEYKFLMRITVPRIEVDVYQHVLAMPNGF